MGHPHSDLLLYHCPQRSQHGILVTVNIQYDKAGECPYILVDDFLDEHGLSECWRTIDSLNIPAMEGPEETGSALDMKTMKPIKQNRGVWLTEIYDKNPGLCPLMDVFIERHAEVCSDSIDMHPAFRCLQHITYSLLLSYYGDADRYLKHTDHSHVTTLFWLCEEEQRFTGGDLILEDSKTIEFKNNRMVMFPGYTYHEVTPVKIDSHLAELGLGRWTVSMFARPK